MGAVIVKSLGSGQSFDLKSLYPDDYKNFTNNNFFIKTAATASGIDRVTISGYTQYIGFSGKIYKSYNSSTGILTAYNYITGNKSGLTGKANVTVYYVSDPSQLTSLGTGTSFNLRDYTVDGSTIYADTYNSLDLEGFKNFLVSGVNTYSTSHSRSTDGTWQISGSTKLLKSNNNGTITLAYSGIDSDQNAETLLPVTAYFYMPYKITVSVEPSYAGKVSGGGTYLYNKTAQLKATPESDYRFVGWWNGETQVSDAATYSLAHIKSAQTLTAKFVPKYTVSVQIEGQEYATSATWAWGTKTNVVLTAVPNENNGQFVGWYVKSGNEASTLISNNEVANYTVTANTVFIAKFARKYAVNLSIVGNGTVDITRADNDKNNVRLSAVPASHYTFEKYVINPSIHYCFAATVDPTIQGGPKLKIQNGLLDEYDVASDYDLSGPNTIIIDQAESIFRVNNVSYDLSDELQYGLNDNIYLFGRRNYDHYLGSVSTIDIDAMEDLSAMRLYSFKAYRKAWNDTEQAYDTTLINNYIPVHSIEDNVNGIYDTVLKEFRKNILVVNGLISDFVAGPSTGTVYEEKYEELEFIESDKTQAVYTKISTKNANFGTLVVECEAETVGTVESPSALFGASSYEFVTKQAYSRVLTDDIVIVAYFLEDDKYHILSGTNIPNFDIYVSQRDGYYGFTAKLFARPYPGYNFVHWQDGNTDNPRTITVTEDINVYATYWKEFDENGKYQYRCYIKDQLALGKSPKAFMRVDSFEANRDLLTTANSTITVYKTDLKDAVDIINDGDILILYDPKGKTLYQGVITSREDNVFHCSQMQSFYKGEWVYETGETPPESYDDKWSISTYAYPEIECPCPMDFYGKTPTRTTTVTDEYTGKYMYRNLNLTFGPGVKYGCQATTYIWTSRPFNVQMTFQSHQGGTYYLNGELVGELPWKLSHNITQVYTFTCQFIKGKNELTVCYRAMYDHDGDHYETTYNPYDENGFAFYMNKDSFEPYDAKKTYKVGDFCQYNNGLYKCITAITTPESWTGGHWETSYVDFRRLNPTETNHIANVARIKDHPYVLGLTSVDKKDDYLEKSIKNILFDYSKGLLIGSDYTDIQVQKRLGGMINYASDNADTKNGQHIVATESTTASLVTAQVGDTMDFEKFIYWLYEAYGIIFDFDIGFSGNNNYVRIRTCPYDSMKVGNNVHAIKDISPIQTVEETNRLVIFSSEGDYRNTIVITKNNEIVMDPTGNAATANRFELTNSKIVYSDDPIEDLVAAYLPNEIYNHKLSFKLLLRNYIYEFEDFKLGMPLEVYYHHDKKQDFYSTVLTGYQIKKNSGEDITEVEFICGLVRQKLTQKITLGRI